MAVNDDQRRGELDPTKVMNQPALRSSNGRVWLIMGALFAAVAMVPFGLLAFAGSGRSAGIAILAGALILGLYLGMIVVRIVIKRRVVRLRVMAVCMLTMAAVALVGVWVCMTIERG